MEEIFESEVRSSGDFAGVFEYDGETGFFYLYRTERDGSAQVIDAIRVCNGNPKFDADDVEIRWGSFEDFVGLFIKGIVWAAFDLQLHHKYGGNYAEMGRPEVPPAILQKFA